MSRDSLGTFVREELGSDLASASACVICQTPFKDMIMTLGRKYEVKLLHCLHSACGKCLEEALNAGQEVTCPFCDAKTGEQNYNKYLCNFSENQSLDYRVSRECQENKNFVINCDECFETCPAAQYCAICIRRLCVECSEHHRRSKATASHQLSALHEQQEFSMHRAAHCPLHTHQLLEFFCETCNAMCCRDCILAEHEHHHYKLPSAPLVDKQRQVLKDYINQLHDLGIILQSRHQQLSQTLKDLDVELENSRQNIHGLERQVKTALEERHRQMLAEVDTFQAGRLQSYESQRAEIASIMLTRWRAIDFLEKVIARGTNCEVILLTGYIRTHRLLSEDVLASKVVELAGQAPALASMQAPVSWAGDVAAVSHKISSMASSWVDKRALELAMAANDAEKAQEALTDVTGPRLQTAAEEIADMQDAVKQTTCNGQSSSPDKHCSAEEVVTTTGPSISLVDTAASLTHQTSQATTGNMSKDGDAAPTPKGTRDVKPSIESENSPHVTSDDDSNAATSTAQAPSDEIAHARPGKRAPRRRRRRQRRANEDTAGASCVDMARGHLRESRAPQTSQRTTISLSEAVAVRQPANSGAKTISILEALQAGAPQPNAEQATPHKAFIKTLGGGNLHYRSDEELQEEGLWGLRAVVGVEGEELGSFRSPCGMAVDSKHLFIADTLNHRIQVFNKFNLEVLGQVKLPDDASIKKLADPSGMCCTEIDGQTTLIVVEYGLDRLISAQLGPDCLNAVAVRELAPTGTFYGPFGVGLSNDHIVVADSCSHRCLMLSSDGEVLREFGSRGSRAGQFEYPQCIATFSDGHIAVSDKDNHRIQVFTDEGKFSHFIPSEPRMPSAGAGGCAKPGFLFGPMGMCVDSGDRIFVADCGSNRIQIFTREGKWLWSSCQASVLKNTGDFQFASPTAVCIDDQGLLFVSSDHCVQVF